MPRSTAGADYVGLVFFPREPAQRRRRPHARLLAARARGKAKIVALLVDPDDALLDDVVDTVSPDILQLHGIGDAGARRARSRSASACRS